MNEMLLPSGESWKPAFSGFLKKLRSGMSFAASDDVALVANPSGDRASAVPAPAMPHAAAALDRKKRRLSMISLLVRAVMATDFWGYLAARSAKRCDGRHRLGEVADKSARAHYPSRSAGLR